MTILRKVLAEDFEKVFPLLLEFNNSRLAREDWKRLFIDHWDAREGYFGYMLADHDKIVGFLSTIFSRRLINGRQHKFCNIGNWIVKPKYRSESAKLLFPVLRIEECAITAFSASSNEVCLMLKKLGFKEVKTDMVVVLPAPSIGFGEKEYCVEFDKDAIRNYLGEKDLKIYCDHIRFKAVHIVFRTRDGDCYVVANKTVRKKLFSLAQIHYISNPGVFFKYIGRLSAEICFKLGVCGLILDRRYSEGRGIKNAFTLKRRYPAFFRSESLGKDDIDSLYSELLVLNL
jgi:hypothetical protein